MKKRNILYLLLITSVLYVIWAIWLGELYYHFIVVIINSFDLFIDQLFTYELINKNYNIQLSINFRYFTTQPLNILCAPVVILFSWQTYLFFQIPWKKALISLLVNHTIFLTLLITDIVAAAFVDNSQFAKYFYSIITANLSLVIIILIFKDYWFMRKGVRSKRYKDEQRRKNHSIY